MMRTMGLDLGERRIGVSLSDPSNVLASPLTTITVTSNERALEEIARLVQGHEVGRIVVGLPKSLDGRLGPQAERVMRFASRLAEKTPATIVYWDERLTTSEAQRILRLQGKKPSRHRQEVDPIAAALILQAYLDRERAAS